MQQRALNKQGRRVIEESCSKPVMIHSAPMRLRCMGAPAIRAHDRCRYTCDYVSVWKHGDACGDLLCGARGVLCMHVAVAGLLFSAAIESGLCQSASAQLARASVARCPARCRCGIGRRRHVAGVYHGAREAWCACRAQQCRGRFMAGRVLVPGPCGNPGPAAIACAFIRN